MHFRSKGIFETMQSVGEWAEQTHRSRWFHLCSRTHPAPLCFPDLSARSFPCGSRPPFFSNNGWHSHLLPKRGSQYSEGFPGNGRGLTGTINQEGTAVPSQPQIPILSPPPPPTNLTALTKFQEWKAPPPEKFLCGVLFFSLGGGGRGREGRCPLPCIKTLQT